MNTSEKLSVIAANEEKVFDAGKKKAIRDFMKAYQESNSVHCKFSGGCWNRNTFYPVKDIPIVSECFMYFNWYRVTEPLDLAKRLEDCGVRLVFANDSTMSGGVFRYAHVTRLPDIDCSHATATFNRVFAQCVYLHTIDSLTFSETNGGHAGTFESCTSLANIKFKGVLASSISFDACPLTYATLADSEYGLIRVLKDFSGTAETRSLTLKASSATLLTDADRAEIIEKGWTLVEV